MLPILMVRTIGLLLVLQVFLSILLSQSLLAFPKKESQSSYALTGFFTYSDNSFLETSESDFEKDFYIFSTFKYPNVEFSITYFQYILFSPSEQELSKKHSGIPPPYTTFI